MMLSVVFFIFKQQILKGLSKMICDVLLTQKDKKFIARVCQYPEIVAEDYTEEGVLVAARSKLKRFLSGGKIVKIDIESESYEHPWLKYAGMFADDSDWEQFQESLKQYRKEIDLD
ncbi:MAG: hypothetical protein HQK76_17190 [Desulfobacterales bacterium]|nr:hypothetical protein [Desulfobacterales bacterium]